MPHSLSLSLSSLLFSPGYSVSLSLYPGVGIDYEFKCPRAVRRAACECEFQGFRAKLIIELREVWPGELQRFGKAGKQLRNGEGNGVEMEERSVVPFGR